MLPVLPPTESATLPAHTSAPLLPQQPLPGFMARLATWRIRQLLKRALRQAGEPNLVLDLPCGDGRLWPLLARHSNRVILAADCSTDVLKQAQAVQPHAVVERVRLLQTSAFAIDLPANAVECVFCTRLFHRLATSKQRLAMLGELHRVTSDSVILSVCVNRKLPFWQAATDLQQRPHVTPAALLAEFKLAGFSVAGHHGLVPGCGSRRIYLLRKEYKK